MRIVMYNVAKCVSVGGDFLDSTLCLSTAILYAVWCVFICVKAQCKMEQGRERDTIAKNEKKTT